MRSGCGVPPQKTDAEQGPAVTCADHRDRMRLLGLRRRLSAEVMSEANREALRREIRQLEAALGLD
jgi:ribosomal protein L30/L7E